MKSLILTFSLVACLLLNGNAQTAPRAHSLFDSDATFNLFPDSQNPKFPSFMSAWAGNNIFVAGGPAGTESEQPIGDWGLNKDPETTCCLTTFGSNVDKEIVMGIKPGATDGEGFYPHAIAMAINTLATKTTEVTWTANSNYVGIGLVVTVTLQYRIGDTGDWTNVEGSLKQGVNRLDETFTHNLPEECDDKELVQLRWLYYFEGDESADVQNGVFINILNISVVALEKPGTTPPPIVDFSFIKNDLEVSFFNKTQNDPLTSILWEFGDGSTSTEEDPIHNYLLNGEYEVCLTASNDAGTDSFCKKLNVIDLTPSPVADFEFLVEEFTVTFTNNTSVETLDSFRWDFGDGSSDTEVWAPQYTYSSQGEYDVCLFVYNENGSDKICKVVKAPNSGGSGPAADFNYTSNGLVFNFTNQSQNGPFDEINWDFGDGNTSANSNPNNIYQTPGSYLVCLELTNTAGTDSICKTVEAEVTSISYFHNILNLEVYPNPADLYITLPYGIENAKNVEIINATGKIVSLQDVENHQLNVAQLPLGFYLIKIKSQDKMYLGKFIKI
jgi:PKD repeat protein